MATITKVLPLWLVEFEVNGCLDLIKVRAKTAKAAVDQVYDSLRDKGHTLPLVFDAERVGFTGEEDE